MTDNTNETEGGTFVYCNECGEAFNYIDHLVDHHAAEHETFDEAMVANHTVQDVED